MISNLRVTIKLEYTCINSCVLNTLWLTEIWARRLSPARDILFSSKPLYPLLSPFYQIQCLIVAVHSELWLVRSMSPDLHTELWLAGVCYWLCPGCWLLAAGCHLSSSSAPTHDTDSLRRTPRPRPHSADAAHTINTPGRGPVQSRAASYIANHVGQNKFCLLYNGSLSFLVNRKFLLGRKFLSAKWPTKLHVCYIKCFQNFR